jgi:glycosyltransferase involved in cell wall biosynthesis
MNILVVTPTFSPLDGGQYTYIFDLSKYLSEQGHTVTIFTTSEKFIESTRKLLPRVAIRVFPSFLGALRYSPALAQAIRLEINRFDVINLHCFWGYPNIVVSRLAVKNKIPYIITLHGTLPILMSKYLLKVLFSFLFGRYILKHAAKFIAVSPLEVEQIKSRGIKDDKITMILSTTKPYPLNNCQKGIFRKKYDIREDEKLVLFLARIHFTKGIDVLLDAFSLLVKKQKKTKLVIAGPDGGYLAQAKKIIAKLHLQNHVIFTGYLEHDEKYQAYLDSDVYTLPSRHEILGITILEAWSCGVPIVISDRNGIASIVSDNNAGAVCSFNAPALFDALFRALNDQRLRNQYIQGGKELLEKQFSYGQQLKRSERLFIEVAK